MSNKDATHAGINRNSGQKQPQPAGNYENAVFVSYGWVDESERVVDELERVFKKHGIGIVRDKRDLRYRGSIREFERRIGQGQCIVLVISDKYLRSPHCMYELLEVSKNHNLRERIFPIVLADARIYNPVERLNYFRYWDERIKELNQAIKQIELEADLEGIQADLNKYVHIRASFDHLTDTLSDMNAFTPELHEKDGFSTLISAIERARSEQKTDFQTREEPGVAARIEAGTPKQGNRSACSFNVAIATVLILVVSALVLTRLIPYEPPAALATLTSMPSGLPLTLTPLPVSTPWPLGNQTTTDPRPACTITVSDSPEPGREHAKALQFSITAENGYCSWIVPLDGYDASRKKQVTFWVRGLQGGEEFKVGIKDRNTIAGQEPKESRAASASWTQMSLPLELFENLDLSSLENFSLNFTTGSGTVYVDRLIFTP